MIRPLKCTGGRTTTLPPPPPPPTTAVVTPVSQPMNESEGLKKSSLVFVRNTTSATVMNVSQSTGQPAFIERKGVSKLLPTGSRLVARLQTAVSSAVKTPAIAVIEYNYERDGEIVIPAGTKAIGQLAQANQNGQVGLRFTGLEMPDGSTESIEGSGVSLDYGPLKGVVNGRNGAKRALVRSMTGIGTVAASLVGGRGYGGLTGPIDQSVLLRERIASNIGLAGEQELMAMAYTQNVVVTLPGNTRFYIVLQESVTTPNRPDLTPAGLSDQHRQCRRTSSADGGGASRTGGTEKRTQPNVSGSGCDADIGATDHSSEEPWKPTGNHSKRRLGAVRCAGFMFMGRSNGINQYKHGLSRRYLFLDDEGRAYEAAGAERVSRDSFRRSFGTGRRAT